MKRINNYITEKLHINKDVKVVKDQCDTLDELCKKYNIKPKDSFLSKIFVFVYNKQIMYICLNIYKYCHKNSTYDLETEIKNKFLKNTKYNFYIDIKNNQVYMQILKDGVLKVLSIYFALDTTLLTINTRHLTEDVNEQKLCYNIIDYIFDKFNYTNNK